MIITKGSVQELRGRLGKQEELPACKQELATMLEIKEALLWRADNACSSCASIGWELPARLFWETQVLREALSALEEKDIAKASSLLGEYGQLLE